jgi:hypothetical protein
MPTMYESAVAPGWHRADHPPRTPWRRFVAARLWLDESFVEALDSRPLETVAGLSRYGRVTALSLRPRRTLAELEAALAPITPALPRRPAAAGVSPSTRRQAARRWSAPFRWIGDPLRD